jgi:hypothetical protein
VRDDTIIFFFVLLSHEQCMSEQAGDYHTNDEEGSEPSVCSLFFDDTILCPAMLILVLVRLGQELLPDDRPARTIIFGIPS